LPVKATKPIELQCDYRNTPIGVDKLAPSLSWKLDKAAIGKLQKAYQIQVATSRVALENDSPDLWDSQRVESANAQNISYQGEPLLSRQVCYWRVRVKCQGDTDFGAWSSIAHWEMALLKPTDWTAHWIRGKAVPPVKANDALNAWMYAAAHVDDVTFQNRPSDWKPETILPKEAERLQAMETATWLRKDFTIQKKVVKARLYSTAAGYGDFYLNGNKLGKRIFNPAQTDFEKRILYDIDVLDDALQPGDHTLAAHLGQGFYGQNAGFVTDRFFYGRPTIIAQLELTYADGSSETIVTDASWHTHPSAVIKNNIYAGEVFDARKYQSDWNRPTDNSAARKKGNAEIVDPSPTKLLVMQTQAPIQIDRRIDAVEILNPAPGVWVFDFGQNFTGFVELNTDLLESGPGDAVWLRYAEWANSDGRIGMASGGGFATRVNQVDTYIRGDGFQGIWNPAFSWHGFRYVEVTGLKKKPELDLLVGCLVRSAVERVGTFKSSDEHLNRIHETALWTYESNLIGIPSDCPIRERCGWTGDAHAALTLSNYNYDMALFWEKYLGDFRTNSSISPSIVPGKRAGGKNPDWPVAQVLIATEHYLFHNDLSIIRDYYPRLCEFMDYFKGLQNKNGIIAKGYGDWCDPVRKPGDERVGGAGKPQQTTPAITTSALFIKACQDMQLLANALGESDKANQYSQWEHEAIKAFNQAFYKDQEASYGSQTADSMALCFEIVPGPKRASVAAALNRNVREEWNGHASVGALGHRWLYPALADNGYVDTAYEIFHAKGHPGYHYLFDELNGTSLWERKGAFNPKAMEQPLRSLSHPFQGGYDAWFYMGLGGIRPDSQHPGFKRIVLNPSFPKGLDWVDVSYRSTYGNIHSRWERKADLVIWDIQLPPNTSGRLQLPKDLATRLIKTPTSNDNDNILLSGKHRLQFKQ